jgi:hypothetical protein
MNVVYKFIMENPIEMDLGGTHILGNLHMFFFNGDASWEKKQLMFLGWMDGEIPAMAKPHGFSAHIPRPIQLRLRPSESQAGICRSRGWFLVHLWSNGDVLGY